MGATRVRVGIVGIGFGQHAHATAFRADARCSIEVIAASDAARASAVAARLVVPRSTGDWREVVSDPNVDVVSVAVPPALQPEIVLAAARAGKHVLCEKPVALTVAEAREMVRVAHHAGIIHAIDFEFPELPTWRRMHELVIAGAIGELRHVFVDWRVLTRPRSATATSWKSDDRQGGGVLGGFTSHVFHNAEWLCGPIVRLRARARGASGDLSAVDLWLEFANGASGSATLATDARAGSGHRMELIGSAGGLRLVNEGPDHGGPFMLSLTRTEGAVETATDPDVVGDRRAMAVASLVRRFVDGVCARTAVRPDLADGVRVQVLLAAVSDSVRSDAWQVV